VQCNELSLESVEGSVCAVEVGYSAGRIQSVSPLTPSSLLIEVVGLRQQAEISDLAMQEKHKLNRHCCNGRFLWPLVLMFHWKDTVLLVYGLIIAEHKRYISHG
jgi:hypothetical protein